MKKKVFAVVIATIIIIGCCFVFGYMVYECKEYSYWMDLFKTYKDLSTEDMSTYLEYRSMFVVHLLIAIFEIIVIAGTTFILWALLKAKGLVTEKANNAE